MLFFFCFLRQQRFSQERIAVLFVDFSLIFELLLLLLIVNSCSIVELVFLVHLQTLYVNCVRELFFNLLLVVNQCDSWCGSVSMWKCFLLPLTWLIDTFIVDEAVNTTAKEEHFGLQPMMSGSTYNSQMLPWGNRVKVFCKMSLKFCLLASDEVLEFDCNVSNS